MEHNTCFNVTAVVGFVAGDIVDDVLGAVVVEGSKFVDVVDRVDASNNNVVNEVIGGTVGVGLSSNGACNSPSTSEKNNSQKKQKKKKRKEKKKRTKEERRKTHLHE